MRSTRRGTVSAVDVGASLELPCGCTGKRWDERNGLIWLSVARACTLHEVAMYQGLWVAPHAKVSRPAGAPPLQTGLHTTRHRWRRRITVHADHDGTTLALCQAMVRQRAQDGTWGFGTLVEGNALPPSTLDVWLLAEFTAALVQEHGPRGPMAVVAPDDGQFAIALAYHEHSAAPAPMPFRTRDEAVAWLDSLGF